MEYVAKVEFDEHSKRMEDEHQRMNNRIKELEENMKENTKLLISVERLATNMENMQKEMQSQGQCSDEQKKEIEELKSRDGKMWRQVIGYLISAIIGASITFAFNFIFK